MSKEAVPEEGASIPDPFHAIERRVRRQGVRLEEVSEQIEQAFATILDLQKGAPEAAAAISAETAEDADRLQAIERRVRRQSLLLGTVSEQIEQALGALGDTAPGGDPAEELPGENEERLGSIEKRVRQQGALLTAVSEQIERALTAIGELRPPVSDGQASLAPDQFQELNRRVRQQTIRLDALAEQGEEVLAVTIATQKRSEATSRALSGELVRLQMGIDALLRRAYLEGVELPYPTKLLSQRFRLLSQNGEDGLSLAIFREIGVESARFVDIGCGYNGGNSGFLARELGWSGVMVDADPHRAAAMRVRFNPERVRVVEEWVTREALNDLIHTHGGDGEIDLLSIDIDGNDYWLWEELDACTPRLVIVEYNAHFGPDRSVVVPYASDFDRHQVRATYYGASLAALECLARRKGYRLILVEPQGVNAYFLRDGVGEAIPGLTAAQAFQSKLRPKVEYDRSPSGARIRDASTELYAYIEEQKLPLVEIE